MKPKEIKLPSGAILKISPAPFEEAKALYQAVLEEIRPIQISAQVDMASVFKDVFCTGFSSKKVEACLWDCMKRAQYCDKRGELKIDKDTFEPVEARADYMPVCVEVAKENIAPFVKSLYALYGQFLETIAKDPA